ncbi:arginine repressor, partial [Clostridium perfringens]|nr:arginine repressor [Clostridium perfringens]
YKYSMPTDQRYNPVEKLKRALIDNFVYIDRTGNLVVMKCLPGTANSVAVLLDNMEWTQIMGTICGDDTILLICRTEDDGEHVVAQIKNFIS